MNTPDAAPLQPVENSIRTVMMPVPFLFGFTLLVSAILLFLVQPMIARMVLPLLGGAPAVWNTCMLFFQAMLLAGYAYAHLTTTHLGRRAQLALHAALVLLAAAFLPFGIPQFLLEGNPAGSNPSGWLFRALLVTVGVPFFVLSATAPLLQAWFSKTNRAGADDPYFLYSASNAGSLLALLAYPLLIEPSLPVSAQGKLWATLFAAFGLLLAASAWLSKPRPGTLQPPEPHLSLDPVRQPDETLTLRRLLRWIALAFVPSSLMLGVTNYLTTDIASVPLFWILPLALYLLTFILAFARRQFISARFLDRALPVAAISLAFPLLTKATEPVWLLMLIHLAAFFVAGLFCHRHLAADRPPPSQLTRFYFSLSVGGVLGGVFNALLAPALFQAVTEYPLAMALACLLRAGLSPQPRRPGELRWDFLAAAALFAAAFALVRWSPAWNSAPIGLRHSLVFGVPLLACYLMVDKPARFALGFAAALLAGSFHIDAHGRVLHAERNFFGVSRVTLDPTGRFRRFVHGNTVHGRQFLEPSRVCEPLAYYHRTGPLGSIFDAFDRFEGSREVAVIGLGTGSMISYSRPGDAWTFYEIDPAVIAIAQDPRFFTFLSSCSAVQVRVVPGDARLRLNEAKPQQYGLIVLDAFSSDSIPIHLLTREAFQLYLSRLRQGGVLALHISNRYLGLEPVVSQLARDAGCLALSWEDMEEDIENGKEPSHWMLIKRQAGDWSSLARTARWVPAQVAPGRVWTDDFSNVLGVLRLN